MVVIIGDGAEWIWNRATMFSRRCESSTSGMHWSTLGSSPGYALLALRLLLLNDDWDRRLIHQLFDLDAHYAEALWALDQPPGSLDMRAMLRDTLAALEQLPAASARFKKNRPKRALPLLASLEPGIRNSLAPSEAYNLVPGRDPKTR